VHCLDTFTSMSQHVDSCNHCANRSCQECSASFDILQQTVPMTIPKDKDRNWLIDGRIKSKFEIGVDIVMISAGQRPRYLAATRLRGKRNLKQQLIISFNHDCVLVERVSRDSATRSLPFCIGDHRMGAESASQAACPCNKYGVTSIITQRHHIDASLIGSECSKATLGLQVLSLW